MNNLQRVERHIFVTKYFDEITHLSKNLYNYANYQFRQIFINVGLVPSAFEVISSLTKEKQIDYTSLPAQTSQQVIKLVEKNWKSFFSAVRAYKKNPKKFLGRPKLPGYKKTNGHNITIFTNQQIRLKNGVIHFPKKANLKPIKTKVTNIKQVRIIPQSSCYVVEVVYSKEVQNVTLDDKLFLGVDLGLGNLATCVDNSGSNPFIINGRTLKSINQFYNKKKAKLQSFVKTKSSRRLEKLNHKRNCKVEDYLHKASRFVTDYCVKNEIKNIVIGNNKNWKQNIKIGRINNQNFVQIPHARFINMIEYKAEEVGIGVTLTEESYTSKCSALDFEKICKHSKYLGKRVKRGLFKASNGSLINADVNGALNILRKVVDEIVTKQIVNRGNVFLPKRISTF